MHVVFAFIFFTGLITGFYPFHDSPKKEVTFAAGMADSLRVRYEVKPHSERIHECLLKQNYDYSCGSAALGTILNNYLGEKFSEKQVIKGLMEYGDKEQIKKLRAFSFWDMQKFVEALGYSCGGYNAEMSDLMTPELWPCIIPIEVFGYRHFVILKGIHKDHIIIADPWRGNSSYTVNQFKTMWYNNILFRIDPRNGHALTCLRMKEQDLRFIDKDMEKTLMFNTDQPFNLPREWEAEFHNPTKTVRRYKQ
ncbi:MAG: C39 family peptidase [Desulfobacteraceae bacterium]|jgi:hypothetical protein